MQIVSWNVASVRARLPLLKTFLCEEKPDIVFLQEIKATSENFPFSELKKCGYRSYIHGQKGFNGVAVLSKKDLQNQVIDIPAISGDIQARFVQVEDDNLIYISVYVPNGNPPLNDLKDTSRLAYKLEWMQAFNNYVHQLTTCQKPIVIGGDFNVIVHDFDVYDAQLFQGNALILPSVRAQFSQLERMPLINTLRYLHPTEKLYSFWDFQQGAAQRNMGMLLDYIFISSILKDKLYKSGIYKQYRFMEKPSDHAPVYCFLGDF